MSFRFAPTVIALALLASSASAFADDASATTSTDIAVPSSCKDSSATTKNKCFADMQKMWTLEQQAFTRQQLAEKRAWRDANPQVVSDDWNKASIAFSQQMAKEAMAFRAHQVQERQDFFATYKTSVAAPDSHMTATGNQPLLPGQAECFQKYQTEQSLPQWLQLCLRQANVEYRTSLREKARINLLGGSSSSSSSSTSSAGN